jgi:integrase
LTTPSKSPGRSRRGSGTTYKVGNSWKTVIQVRGVRISATNPNRATSRRQAIARAKERESLGVCLKNTPGSSDAGAYILDWIKHSHESRQIVESTRRRYLGLFIHHIANEIKDLELSQVNKFHINAMLSGMALRGQSPRSREQARALLHRVFNDAVGKGIIPRNVISDVPKIKYEKTPISPLSPQELLQILKDTNGLFMHARIHAAAVLGLRQGEALGLRWSDLNFEDGTLTIATQATPSGKSINFQPLKTKASIRKLHLSQISLEAFENHKSLVEEMSHKEVNWINNDLIFPNSTGGLLSPKLDYKRWQQILIRSGISVRSLHSARHTAGTLLYELGNDIETIRRILGHSNIQTTSRIYVHFSSRPLEVAAEKHNRFLSGVGESIGRN